MDLVNAKMAAAGELAEFQRKAHEGEIRLLHQSLADCEAAHEARCADLVARMATATAEISVLKSEIESLSTLNRQAESRVSEVTTSKGKIEKLLQQALVRESRSAAHVAVLNDQFAAAEAAAKETRAEMALIKGECSKAIALVEQGMTRKVGKYEAALRQMESEKEAIQTKLDQTVQELSDAKRAAHLHADELRTLTEAAGSQSKQLASLEEHLQLAQTSAHEQATLLKLKDRMIADMSEQVGELKEKKFQQVEDTVGPSQRIVQLEKELSSKDQVLAFVSGEVAEIKLSYELKLEQTTASLTEDCEGKLQAMRAQLREAAQTLELLDKRRCEAEKAAELCQSACAAKEVVYAKKINQMHKLIDDI